MGLIEAALGIEWKYFYCHFAIKDCSVKPGPQGMPKTTMKANVFDILNHFCPEKKLLKLNNCNQNGA